MALSLSSGPLRGAPPSIAAGARAWAARSSPEAMKDIAPFTPAATESNVLRAGAARAPVVQHGAGACFDGNLSTPEEVPKSKCQLDKPGGRRTLPLQT
jgi:hypothetical protein